MFTTCLDYDLTICLINVVGYETVDTKVIIPSILRLLTPTFNQFTMNKMVESIQDRITTMSYMWCVVSDKG